MSTQKYFEFLQHKYSADDGDDDEDDDIDGDVDVNRRKFVKTNRWEQKFSEFSFFLKQAMMMMTDDE